MGAGDCTVHRVKQKAERGAATPPQEREVSKTKETIKDFIENQEEYATNCKEVFGEKSIEYITAQYAVDILYQLAEDLFIDM